ncbi:hypothetical protein [Flaviaesturariibacter aridisoli]|uniref:Uncharacterized protein n=1 Tax=Flaviaesturariibacter aridisoli TaxID=2545761 RepID=A0A4R4DRR1_9BACT|nr:hypothetical protein [Flaviaesturariibacter aridisoli]TCZ65197.1 hypothetical protein E0486_17625 [Flaviaesturariibacter aridisoli]
MAYSFSGFIGTLEPVQRICTRFILARPVSLGQDLFLVPLTDELREQMTSPAAEPVPGFELLTGAMEPVALSASMLGPLAYVEVTHWKGEGSEAGIIWEAGARLRTIRFGQGLINTVLKHLGCTANEGADEFTTLGFGRRRFTDDWLAE